MGTLNYAITKKAKLLPTNTTALGVNVVASRCIGKAPPRGGYVFNQNYRDQSEKIWNTRVTKSINAAKFHAAKDAGDCPTYIVRGESEDGAPITEWTPAADFVTDYHWDGRTVGHIRKVNGRFSVEFDNSIVRRRVYENAMNGYNQRIRNGNAQLTYNFADDVWRMTNLLNNSQHEIAGDSDLDRLRAHWTNFQKTVNEVAE